MAYLIVSAGALVILLFVFVMLYRFRRPDQLVIIYQKGRLVLCRRRIYFKKFALPIPASVQTVLAEVNTQAKGKIDIAVKVSVSFYPDPERVDSIVRVGGWNPDCVERISKELRGTAQGLISDYAEQKELSFLTREELAQVIKEKLKLQEGTMGIKVTAVTVQKLEAIDEKIAEAIRQLEEAKIQERAEKAIQDARLSQAITKLETNQRIMEEEHKLEMRSLTLKEAQEIEGAKLAKTSVQMETERRRLLLEVEKEELDVILKNPKLFLLAPQLAKLTEASQQFKNAETVINVSSDAISRLPGMLKELMHWIGSDHDPMAQLEVKSETGKEK